MRFAVKTVCSSSDRGRKAFIKFICKGELKMASLFLCTKPGKPFYFHKICGILVFVKILIFRINLYYFGQVRMCLIKEREKHGSSASGTTAFP